MSYSEASNRELNDQLQTLVAAGDEAARTRMIEGNMRLVAYKVEQFLSASPQFAYMKDDLLSEGFLGLTKGVNRIRDQEVGDPTAYLAQCIRKHLLSAVGAGDTVRVPRNKKRLVRQPIGRGVAYSPDATQETLESVIDVCGDVTEKTIVSLRAEGYSDAEIAARVGLSRSRVTTLRTQISEKFAEREC